VIPDQEQELLDCPGLLRRQFLVSLAQPVRFGWEFILAFVFTVVVQRGSVSREFANLVPMRSRRFERSHPPCWQECPEGIAGQQRQ
jgi:hypothetical protein